MFNNPRNRMSFKENIQPLKSSEDKKLKLPFILKTKKKKKSFEKKFKKEKK